ncbi:MAG: arsenate reductase ArsC [Erysipelothrix sp.]|nr:arsenate reductase ArsC [Erysipelothrix sp.]
MKKLNVGFICVHNSCRSQMAEAIGKLKYADKINVYSAGSEMSRNINEDAVRIIKDLYNVNMIKTQKPKLITDIPKLDVVITMGCDVYCPILENQYSEDWDLDDPSGQNDSKFIEVINQIEVNMENLLQKLNL